MPEDLGPEKHIKELERERKRLLKGVGGPQKPIDRTTV
jgi:hypothetical protein